MRKTDFPFAVKCFRERPAFLIRPLRARRPQTTPNMLHRASAPA
jgi:hypothetical protein